VLQTLVEAPAIPLRDGQQNQRSYHGLSLCIPVLDEEGAIGHVLTRALRAAALLQPYGIDDLEIIVVDDGSRDRTPDIVTAFPEVRLIRHAGNRGYGAALKTAFASARHDLIAFIDGDGTYPPEALPQLCLPVLQGTADLVVGSRRGGAPSRMPLTRRMGNLLFANLLALVTRSAVNDSTSGMRVFHRDVLDVVTAAAPLPDGLHLTPAMSRRAISAGLRMAEVPIAYDERVGRSKLSVPRDGVRFLWSILARR
jgi:glycosyltransferase involved in cell wall biosynthesis